ncbi:hypothetical protein P7H60_07705 [Vagococcus carniphilus]|uniref:hypothetical protein n=1 Tax=Vagococcus carniphilus TaxID=218144 RepID=UPI00288D8AC4|nr:hypothetical protein [Vagococcus carniphilus]MDT2849047.1 hypothetical protein [Vagococcus carniphilus]MDT2864363.1 hypothetical protein [Vagococcus carniphilus]
MLVSKKKYEELVLMNSKLEEDYQGIINEMRIEAEKEREYLINEIIGLKALSKLNEELEKKNYCILGIEKNELGDLIAVTSTRGDKASDILLYSLKENKYKSCNNQPRVLVSGKFLNKELKIDDIQSMENNKNSGNGTILLKYLKKEAKRWGYNTITADLGTAEPKKLSKLVNFYEKNGYDVTLKKDETAGSVKIIL